MPFLLANDSIEILVPAGQKICVTSYGAGTAKIETATEPGNYPASFSLLTSITNSDYTSSAFTRDTTVKITAGLCDAEYVAGANPFPTIHRITTDSNGNILLDGNSIIEVNNSTPALRITQLGSGHALLVEDEANPDSSPFVVNNAGNVGVGIVPSSAWHVNFKAISAGSYGNLAGDNSNGFFEFLNNCYASGANTFNYSSSLAATRYSQQLGKHVWYNSATGTSGNPISFTQAMTLDSSGNLGIGAVPSAWSAIGHKALQLPALASYSAGFDYANNISLNAVRVSGGGWSYMQSGIPSSLYQSGTGEHKWFVAPSGTAGNAITFNQAMTLNSDGKLSVGTTSQSSGFNLNSGASSWFTVVASSSGASYAQFIKGGTTTVVGYLGTDGGGISGSGTGDNFGIRAENSLIFLAGGGERLRVTSGGNLLVSTQIDSGNRASFNYANNGGPAGLRLSSATRTSSENNVSAIEIIGNEAYGRVFNIQCDGQVEVSPLGTTRFKINNNGIVFTSQLAPDAVDATATLTTANLSKKIITSTTAAAVAGTLPTGTLMDGAFGTVSDLAFDWTVINTGPNTFTLSAGTGHTIVGNAAVATNTSGTFRSRRTGTATWVSYRIS
jgi:hypothetical protein